MRINQEHGIAVVVVEQNLEFASRLADHAVVMDKGRIVDRLPTEDLMNDKGLQQRHLGV